MRIISGTRPCPWLHRLALVATVTISAFNIAAAKRGKQALDPEALKKVLGAVTAEFQKLEKNLKYRKGDFLVDLRKPGFDPADAVRLDSHFQKQIQSAANLDTRWLKSAHKGGRKNPKSQNWERKISREHEVWVKQTMAAGENPKASRNSHLASLKLMQSVVGRTQDETALAAFRPRVAGLYQISGQHSDAVRAYLELADPGRTTNAPLRIRYLNRAATSQAILASWPSIQAAPWRDVASGKIKAAGTRNVTSDRGQRKELKEILARLSQEQGGIDNLANWNYDAQIGLIDWSGGQFQEAMDLWKLRLNSQASLNSKLADHRSQAGGFTLVKLRETKSWAELETAARQGIALRWKPAYGNRKIDAMGMLGDAVFEGGKALLIAGDAANAEIKLADFTANFKKDSRYEEAFFLRGKSERGARHFVDALVTFKDFTGRFPRSRFAEEATRTGFELSTDMADEESGLYFGKRYMTMHSNGERGRQITEAYAQLALGNGFYGDGIAALEKLAGKIKSTATRTDALARILDIQILIGSPESVLETANRLMRLGNLTPSIQMRVFRAQARAAAATGKNHLLARARTGGAKLWANLGESDQQNRDAWGEVLFIDADSRGHKELAEAFSLSVRDPHAHLIRIESEYNKIKGDYDQVCAIGRNIYCAAALFRTARVAERFTNGIADLGIADTLEAEVVDRFKNKKTQLTEQWKKDVSAADAQAGELAGQGAAAPGYALAIQLGGGADLILDDRTISGLHGFTQIDAR